MRISTMKAKCLCGNVSLEVEHDKHVHACHCGMCRIWGSGATFSLIAAKPPKIDGENIARYHSSEWAERAFCKNCGTHLFYHFLPNDSYFVFAGLFADNADAEIRTLGKLDTKHQAVADVRFKSLLEGATDGQGRIELKQYAPNELRYTSDNSKAGVAVFSEIYYPGWTATIDGQPVEVARVNYVLRALRVPAGRHEIVFSFRPTSVSTTEGIAYVAFALLIVGFLFAAWRQWRTAGKESDEAETPAA